MASAIPILTYHSLHALGRAYETDDHVALSSDLETIAACGYRVASLTEVARYAAGLGAPWLEDGRWVALSFDDGADWDYYDLDDDDLGYIKSFYTILREHYGRREFEAPLAVSFVIASPSARAELDRACMAGRNNWQDRWWQAAARTGILGIGNHSWDHAHPVLPAIAQREQQKGSFYGIDTVADADRQIRDAEAYIRTRLNGPSTGLFAYPYGEAPDYLVREYLPRFAAELGIGAAFTTECDFVTAQCNRWKLPRFVHGDGWRTQGDLLHLLRFAAGRTLVESGVGSADSKREMGDPPLPAPALPRSGSDLPFAPAFVSRSQSVELQADATLTDASGEPPRPELSADHVLSLEEVTHPRLFVGELFHRHFGSDVPSYPAHMVAFCRAPKGEIWCIGYMHALASDDMVFCGGIVVDEEQRLALPADYRRITRGRQGVMEFMLNATIRRNADAAALWSYVGDPIIEGAMLNAGFIRTPHPHLLARWNAGLSAEERRARLDAVAAMGPF